MGATAAPPVWGAPGSDSASRVGGAVTAAPELSGGGDVGLITLAHVVRVHFFYLST